MEDECDASYLKACNVLDLKMIQKYQEFESDEEAIRRIIRNARTEKNRLPYTL